MALTPEQNRDEIIAMAREAGLLPDNSHPAPETRAMRQRTNAVQRFAALVAAKEREACAKLIEGMTERKRWLRGGINGEATKPCEYAAAIRERSRP